MAVAFGSAGTFLTYGSRTNSTLVAPASIANGDLLIAYLATAAASSAPTPTAPGGWTALTGSPTNNSDEGGFNVKYYIFWKIASSEAGNYTFTHGSGSSCGVVVRYTGVDNTTPFSPTPTNNTGTTDQCTATGFTTTNANTFIIFTEQDWADNTNDTVVPTGTTPTFTERLDATLIYIADGTLASAGATGNKTHTCNTAGTFGGRWAAYLIGLNPATGGGAPVTLNANPGSYTLTGGLAGLAGRAILDGGSYALTGAAAAFAYKQTVAAGAYTLSGTAAGLNVTANLVFPAAAGSYTLTGTDATFAIASGSFTLFCGSGSYNLSGADAAFPGYEPITPPVQPSPGSGYAGAWSGPKRRKRKRDEIEELIDAVIQGQAPAPQIPPQTPQIPQPPPPALIDMTAKMQAVGLTPPQRKIVKRAIVSDDQDDDEEAIELLLNLLS